MLKRNKSVCFANQNQKNQATTIFQNNFMHPNDSFPTTTKGKDSQSLHRTKSSQFFNSDSKKQDPHDQMESVEPNIELRLEKQNYFKEWSDSMVRFKKTEHVRINRARLFDWFVEVCYNFNQSWQTLWTAIGILDRIIIEKGKITHHNIHLYGTTALFIASKYIENYNAKISLDHFVQVICHNKFTRENILMCEVQIFTWICITRNDLSFHFPTIQDRVFECSPGATEEGIKLIMIEAFYFVQDPHMIFDQEAGDITEKELVSSIRKSLMDEQRFSKCLDIQTFYFSEYGCNNIRKFGLKLRN